MAFEYWLSTVAIKPVYAHFREYLHDLLGRELQKTLQRSPCNSLTPEQKQTLQVMILSVAGKMVGDAARSIGVHEELAVKEQLAHFSQDALPQ